MEFISQLVSFLSTIAFFNVAKIFGITSFDLPITIAFLLFSFIYTTIKLNFIQFRKFKYVLSLLFRKEKKSANNTNEISSVKAFLSTIAGNTGLGSTSGIAAMILAGGPGTVFWIPFVVFIQMAFRFIEIYLGHKNRKIGDPENNNGPIKYIQVIFTQMKMKHIGVFLAFSYALFISLNSLGVAMLEINQAVDILNNIFETNTKNYRFELSLIISIFVSIVIFGGIKRITDFFAFIIPILSIIFISCSLYIIIVNFQLIPNALLLIVKDAFNIKQGIAGIVAGLMICFKRMCVASETGLGTSAVMHSNSAEKDSIKEAYQGMISPLVSGIGISFLIGLVIVITKSYQNTTINGILLVQKAFASEGSFFPLVITLLFPIMTINVTIAWSYYSVKSAQVIFGKYIKNIYTLLYIFIGFVGGYIDNFGLILSLLDTGIMLTASINVFAILIGTNFVKKEIANS